MYRIGLKGTVEEIKRRLHKTQIARAMVGTKAEKWKLLQHPCPLVRSGVAMTGDTDMQWQLLDDSDVGVRSTLAIWGSKIIKDMLLENDDECEVVKAFARIN